MLLSPGNSDASVNNSVNVQFASMENTPSVGSSKTPNPQMANGKLFVNTPGGDNSTSVLQINEKRSASVSYRAPGVSSSVTYTPGVLTSSFLYSNTIYFQTEVETWEKINYLALMNR
eukprot:UN27913